MIRPTSLPQDSSQGAAGRWRVAVGHAVVTVEGRSAAEAILAARSELCRELPRMWDVIRGMEDARFQVTQLPESSPE